MKKALGYYEKACDLGDGEGCYRAGIGYDKGSGAKKDPVKAKQLHDKACKLGFSSACPGETETPDTGFKLVEPKIAPKPFPDTDF